MTWLVESSVALELLGLHYCITLLTPFLVGSCDWLDVRAVTSPVSFPPASLKKKNKSVCRRLLQVTGSRGKHGN